MFVKQVFISRYKNTVRLFTFSRRKEISKLVIHEEWIKVQGKSCYLYRSAYSSALTLDKIHVAKKRDSRATYYLFT